MKREIFFFFLCVISFLFIIIGLALAIYSILSNNVFAIGLIFPTGTGLCLLALYILNFMIDFPLTAEILEERDIEKEKKILGTLVLFGNIFYLFTISIFLFHAVTLFSKYQPEVKGLPVKV